MAEATVVLTVGEAVARTTELLTRAGAESPRLDAELLVAEVAGVGRERLILEPDRQVDLTLLGSLAARRAGREPIAYILGRKGFRGLTLAVDTRVLIPRPETELLVEVGLRLEHGARVLDVGTGSGAVALALKDERPDLDVWGVEESAPALEVARANARSLGIEVRLVCGDLLEGVPGEFDAVLANLPYVADGADLPPEISEFEPRGALFAGPDGLAVIRRLVAQAADVPLLALEIGFDQADAVSELMRAAGFASVERLHDLAGHERVIVGRRP